MIARKVHPVFGIIWAAWYGCVIASLAMPTRTLFGLAVLLSFLPVELTAVFMKTGMRDTLSETMTFLQRKFAKDRDFARGWNALFLLLTVAPSFLLYRTALAFSGNFLLAGTFGLLTLVWLYDHWMNPDVRG